MLFIQNKVFPSYEDIPPAARVEVATRSASSLIEAGGADLFWSILGPAKLDKAWYKKTAIWYAVGRLLGKAKFDRTEQLDSWRKIQRRLISAYPDQEYKDIALTCWTGFAGFYFYLSNRLHRQGIPNCLDHCSRSWVEELALAGYDVKRHRRLLSQTLSNHEVFLWSHLTRKQNLRVDVRLRVIGLTCGSGDEEWKVWTSWPLDEWAGDFWNLVEHPELFMPGSWIDAHEPENCIREYEIGRFSYR